MLRGDEVVVAKPRCGQKSQPTLDSIETRILRHYRKISAPDAIEPSLFLLQAPIFHGYALALYLELEQAADLAGLSEALSGDRVVILNTEEEWPSNVSSAGQPDLQLSLKPDPAQPNGVWLWLAADNLRTSALTAVECAETMTATRPTGKIQ